MYTEKDIKEIVARQRAFFNSGTTLDVSWRIEQLKILRKAIEDHEEDMVEALRLDLGRHPMEGYFCDIGPVIMEINETIAGLKKWARPEIHFSGLTCFPSLITKVYKAPYGVTLIISPFNFPFMLSFGVLLAAIAGAIRRSSRLPASPASARLY